MKKLVNKIKDNLNIFQSSKGFTLLELLVVVLIIGILAGIALPQYQMAVAKSKFASMRINVKAMSEALDRYYLIHNQYTTDISALDIDITEPDCDIKSYVENIYANCKKKIAKQDVTLIYWKGYPRYKECMVTGYVNDKTTIAHRLCQAESGKQTPSSCDSGNFVNCHYTFQ